jgi:hypothetical protein
MVLRMLCDRRDEISRARAQALNRMHRLFLELPSAGAPVKKSTEQYKVLLARDVVQSVLAHHRRQAGPQPPAWQPAPGYRPQTHAWERCCYICCQAGIGRTATIDASYARSQRQ